MRDAGAALPEAPGVVFQRYLKGGELWLQQCDGCARQIFYPRTLCPYCGDNHLQWRRASGAGTVYSTTVVRQRPERGGDYNVAIIELAEGARLLSRVEGTRTICFGYAGGLVKQFKYRLPGLIDLLAFIRGGTPRSRCKRND